MENRGWKIENRDLRSSIFSSRKKNQLVSKVSHAGENHRDAMLIGRGNDFVVLDDQHLGHRA